MAQLQSRFGLLGMVYLQYFGFEGRCGYCGQKVEFIPRKGAKIFSRYKPAIA